MNDIEKAINYWKQFKKEIKKLREIKPGAEWDEQEKATDLAISALEKQSDKNCSRCADRNRCAIHKNFNIDYCSDWSVEE